MNDLNKLSLPGIAVQRGDLIAITQLKPNCGGVTYPDTGRQADAVYMVSGDFNGGSITGAQVYPYYALNAATSGGPNRLVGVLPVAGSAPGNFNSFFRTQLSIARRARP